MAGRCAPIRVLCRVSKMQMAAADEGFLCQGGHAKKKPMTLTSRVRGNA